jgi:eukaryotic-like serine/threonine-protein kinase
VRPALRARTPNHHPGCSPRAEGEHPRWSFEEGAEIAPGRYALRRLGGGHRYEAYLAWDDRLHAVVVAKVIRPHLVRDPHTLDGLAAEARMLERLHHPVIVRSFGALLEGPRPHLALEHLEGPRLSTLVRRYGPLSTDQLIPLAIQICSALHYLALEEVVHLDIKPANVIMGAPPRLIDLSVARSVERCADLDRPIGTDAYMAPEQCDPARLGPVSASADVFGLGATLYRAATGERPFPLRGDEGPGPGTRWPQLACEPAPIDGRLPDPVARVILACLDRDPAARPRPAEISERLELALDGLPKLRLARLKPRLRAS